MTATMKRNLYYRTVFRRHNIIAEAFLGFFLAFCSWPRLVLEVFLRRNMGERYFSMASAISIAILLALFPLGLSALADRFHRPISQTSFLLHYATWYGFTAAFLYRSYQRQEEIKHLPSVYDFKRFSLSTGLIHPWFWKLEFLGKQGDERQISTLLEPGFCFAVGLGLAILGQSIGSVLIWCSLFYALSYQAAYRNGDHFVMDKIDERIANEELVKSFVEGYSPDDTRGFSFLGRRPADPDMRRQLVDSFFEQEPTMEAI